LIREKVFLWSTLVEALEVSDCERDDPPKT
jgi:hypothetical protein